MRKSLTNGAAAGASILSLVAGLGVAGVARAGGGPDKLLLLIDPTSPESMYVGNYYKQVRRIPDSNVLYLVPSAFDYADFVEINAQAVLGAIEQRGIADHIDYILVAPSDQFWIPAAGLVRDNCSAVTRFSLSSIYSSIFIADEILFGGGIPVGTPNRYAATGDDAIAFDSSLSWYGGEPSTRQEARRYFIGGTLGYLGERGNTVDEIIAMIDRSASADGQRPVGTFYFQTTNDNARSGPRDGNFDAAVASIQALGGSAVNNCCDPLPIGAHDCLGIMTGAATPDVPGSDFTLLPGAFADHLTSWAATFDRPSQTKVSAWIAKGASGSHGTIEEPCNYRQKFPHPRMHVYYYQGLSLGESLFRSLAWFPFQGLSCGDPLTRPFAYLPEVGIREDPSGPVSGVVRLTPIGRTSHPDARVVEFELQVDGRSLSTVRRGESFRLDTRRLSDGVHEIRVIGYDDTPVRSQGEFVRLIEVNNTGASSRIEVSPSSGTLAQEFTIAIQAEGGEVAEARIHSNGRVVAATDNPDLPVVIYGATLGAGEVDLVAEVEFTDGRVARSTPVSVAIDFDLGAPSAIEPIAYSYATEALANSTSWIALPATFDNADDSLTYEIVEPPAQGRLLGRTSRPYRLLVPDPNASGFDRFTWRARSSSGESEVATVTVVYEACGGQPMSLAVGPLVGGQPGRFVVTCGFPGTRTYLAYSRSGEGHAYVPQLGVALGIAQPELVDRPKQTNENGMAQWRIDLPDPGRPVVVWFQATQLGVTSNIVTTQVN